MPHELKFFNMYVNEAPGAGHFNSPEDKAADYLAGFAGQHETTRDAFIRDGLNHVDIVIPEAADLRISEHKTDDENKKLVAALRKLVDESLKVDRTEFAKLLEQDWDERHESAEA
jgi:hypothetical protein